VRWTRTLLFIAGRWRFTTTTDDGVRVWVDSTLVIDQWVDQPPDRSYGGNRSDRGLTLGQDGVL
jgi:hypothetical protein